MEPSTASHVIGSPMLLWRESSKPLAANVVQLLPVTPGSPLSMLPQHPGSPKSPQQFIELSPRACAPVLPTISAANVGRSCIGHPVQSDRPLIMQPSKPQADDFEPAPEPMDPDKSTLTIIDAACQIAMESIDASPGGCSGTPRNIDKSDLHRATSALRRARELNTDVHNRQRPRSTEGKDASRLHHPSQVPNVGPSAQRSSQPVRPARAGAQTPGPASRSPPQRALSAPTPRMMSRDVKSSGARPSGSPASSRPPSVTSQQSTRSSSNRSSSPLSEIRRQSRSPPRQQVQAPVASSHQQNVVSPAADRQSMASMQAAIRHLSQASARPPRPMPTATTERPVTPSRAAVQPSVSRCNSAGLQHTPTQPTVARCRSAPATPSAQNARRIATSVPQQRAAVQKPRPASPAAKGPPAGLARSPLQQSDKVSPPATPGSARGSRASSPMNTPSSRQASLGRTPMQVQRPCPASRSPVRSSCSRQASPASEPGDRQSPQMAPRPRPAPSPSTPPQRKSRVQSSTPPRVLTAERGASRERLMSGSPSRKGQVADVQPAVSRQVSAERRAGSPMTGAAASPAKTSVPTWNSKQGSVANGVRKAPIASPDRIKKDMARRIDASTLAWLADMLQPPNAKAHGSKKPLAKEEPPEKVDIVCDQIRFHESVGSGSFGTVWRGEYAGQIVAIKQCNVMDPRDHQLLLGEIRCLRRLHHPRLVNFLGSGGQAPNILILMEFMSGGSLHELLFKKKQALTFGQMLRMSLEVTEGLSYLHSRGVIHRDLKTMNIVLDDKLGCKICDFGLTVMLERSHVTVRSLQGSPRYMAPEQFETSAKITDKVDIWQTGCVFLELFCLSVPFAHCKGMQQIVNELLIRNRPPTIPGDADPRARSLIAACLRIRAHARTTAAVLENALRRLLSLCPDEVTC